MKTIREVIRALAEVDAAILYLSDTTVQKSDVYDVIGELMNIESTLLMRFRSLLPQNEVKNESTVRY